MPRIVAAFNPLLKRLYLCHDKQAFFNTKKSDQLFNAFFNHTSYDIAYLQNQH